MKLSFIFPGQGSQYVGMGKKLYEDWSIVRHIYEEASKVLGFDVAKVSFNGPEEELVKTYITQPAILVYSVAGVEVLKSESIAPDLVAGHSVGEYSALVTSGALDFEDALRLTKLRGQLMWEAGTKRKGGMAAIIGLSPQEIHRICTLASNDGVVVPANFNSPGQVVISGDEDCVDKACDLARSQGAMRTMKLRVSGAFHSPLMEEASVQLKYELDKANIKDARIPVVVNCSAKPLKQREALRDALEKQLRSPVLWEQSIRTILEMGVTEFLEVGPGRVLKGLLRRIDRKASAYSLDDFPALKDLKDQLKVSGLDL